MSIKPRHPEKINKPINPIKKNQIGLDQKLLTHKFFFKQKKLLIKII